jgi:hypothetical protein
MIAWILSKLFPPSEPIYHTYRRETKKIPVLTPSQAWAHYLHMRKGISTFGMSAKQIYDELPCKFRHPLYVQPGVYEHTFEFRNTLLPGGSK